MTTFDLFIMDEKDLKAIELWQKIKANTQKKSQCGITYSLSSKYPNVSQRTFKLMLAKGFSLDETEVIAEQVNNMPELKQLTTIMLRT